MASNTSTRLIVFLKVQEKRVLILGMQEVRLIIVQAPPSPQLSFDKLSGGCSKMSSLLNYQNRAPRPTISRCQSDFNIYKKTAYLRPYLGKEA